MSSADLVDCDHCRYMAELRHEYRLVADRGFRTDIQFETSKRFVCSPLPVNVFVVSDSAARNERTSRKGKGHRGS